MSQLIDIFLEPAKTFTELKDKPNFLIPALLSLSLMTVLMFLYFNKVDSNWMFEQQMAASGREMSAAELAQAKKFMVAGPKLAVSFAIGAVISYTIIYCLMGLYYLIAGKITGHSISFSHGLSMTAWSGMPIVLGAVVALIGVFSMTPQTMMDALFMTHLDPLLMQLPADDPWKFFASKVDLLSIWSVFLGATGWKIWTKSSWLQATIVAALPTLLIYGGMAAFALMKT